MGSGRGLNTGQAARQNSIKGAIIFFAFGGTLSDWWPTGARNSCLERLGRYVPRNNMIHRIVGVRTGLFLASYFLLAAGLQAQDATGKIAGDVMDPTGAVIAGAKVTVTNIATQISKQATTDKDGFYQVSQLPIGLYEVGSRGDGLRALGGAGEELARNQPDAARRPETRSGQREGHDHG